MSAGASTKIEQGIGNSAMQLQPKLPKLSRVGSNSEEDFAVEDAFFKLSALSYQYKRESRMLGKTPDVEVFAKRVQEVFRQFCQDCGLSIADIPELDAIRQRSLLQP